MMCECKDGSICEKSQRLVSPVTKRYCQSTPMYLINRDVLNREDFAKRNRALSIFKFHVICWFFVLSIWRRVSRTRINEISNERMRICSQCRYRNKILNQCSLCLCFLPAKTLSYTEFCPMGFWGPVERLWSSTKAATPISPAGKIGPYHRDDIAAVYNRLASGQGARSKGGCGCGSKSASPVSLPIIQGDP